MDYDFSVYRLSNKFLNDYPQSLYPEILHKSDRPYTCLLIDLHIDFYICIPFRSDIRHEYAYLFTGSARSKKTRSGLDYTKIVIINDNDYLDTVNPAVVDTDEKNEMVHNINRIVRAAVKYVDTYIAHMKGIKIVNAIRFSKMYQYSTLRYFHDILGI